MSNNALFKVACFGQSHIWHPKIQHPFKETHDIWGSEFHRLQTHLCIVLSIYDIHTYIYIYMYIYIYSMYVYIYIYSMYVYIYIYNVYIYICSYIYRERYVITYMMHMWIYTCVLHMCIIMTTFCHCNWPMAWKLELLTQPIRSLVKHCLILPSGHPSFQQNFEIWG